MPRSPRPPRTVPLRAAPFPRPAAVDLPLEGPPRPGQPAGTILLPDTLQPGALAADALLAGASLGPRLPADALLADLRAGGLPQWGPDRLGALHGILLGTVLRIVLTALRGISGGCSGLPLKVL